MREVLADALFCFQKGLVRQRRRVQQLARDAEEWLFSDDARWPFSFVSTCAVLGWSRSTSGKDLGAEAKTVCPRQRGNRHTWWNAKDGWRRKARRRSRVLWHAHSSFL
jgi:hypothetical protein